jgi:hypothetical protein
MAVTEQIAAILADPTLSPGQQRRAIASLKAEAIQSELAKLQGAAFTLDAVRWTVHEAGLSEQGGEPVLRAVLSARVAPNGAWLIEQSSPRNPFYWYNPPIAVRENWTPPTSPGQSGSAQPALREDLASVARDLLRALLR